jgi:hypothetical protein
VKHGSTHLVHALAATRNIRLPTLTKKQRTVLVLWLDGSGSSFGKGIRSSAYTRYVAQCVRKEFLATASGLPFTGRRRRTMTLTITPAGRAALPGAP